MALDRNQLVNRINRALDLPMAFLSLVMLGRGAAGSSRLAQPAELGHLGRLRGGVRLQVRRGSG